MVEGGNATFECAANDGTQPYTVIWRLRRGNEVVTTISSRSSRAVNGTIETGGVICVYKYIACIAPSFNFGHLNLLVERYERGIPLSNVPETSIQRIVYIRPFEVLLCPKHLKTIPDPQFSRAVWYITTPGIRI